MRRVIYLLFIIVSLSHLAADTTFLSHTTIRRNTTWRDTLRLKGDVSVEDGILTIEPGTAIFFGDPGGNSNPNPVFDTWHVALRIAGQGVIRAIGTPDKMILFKKAYPGGFGTLKFEALERDSLNILQYCILADGFRTIEFRNPSDNPDESSCPTIDRCVLTRTAMRNKELMYVTGGPSPTITNCIFENSGCGIFFHGAGTDFVIKHTVFRNLSCATYNASMDPWYNMQVTYDHCTFYGLSGFEFASQPVGNGFAIITANRPGTINCHNTIFADISRAALRDYNVTDPLFDEYWTFNNDYNCFYMCKEGPVRDVEMGVHSMEDTDPVFTDPDSGDFSLQAGSPCLNAANDGTHIGAWQGVVGISDYTRFLPLETTLSANPFRERVSISFSRAFDGSYMVRNITGQLVFEGLCQGRVLTWQGRDKRGKTTGPGVYLLQINLGHLRVFKLVKL